jgi:hypothetical protein
MPTEQFVPARPTAAMTRVFTVTAILLALAVALPGGASAAPAEGPLWATVNTCAPNSVGMRVSVPGDGTGKRQFVRFSAQWWSQARQDWRPLAGAPDSPWIPAGTSRASWTQAGWTYSIQQPPPGAVFLIRGIAQIQWRDGGSVARSSTQVTHAGALGLVVGSAAGSCRLP